MQQLVSIKLSRGHVCNDTLKIKMKIEILALGSKNIIQINKGGRRSMQALVIGSRQSDYLALTGMTLSP